MRYRSFTKPFLLLLIVLAFCSPVHAFKHHFKKHALGVNQALASIQSFEVETFKPLFNPNSPASPNPEIIEYGRYLLDHSVILPTASSAEAQLKISCDNAYCLTLTAGIYTHKGQPPVWTYHQRTYWFFDMPKNPKTLARNMVHALETEYQASVRASVQGVN